MNTSLKNASLHIFQQLTEVLHQFSDSLYTSSLPILSGSTIGKHVRHIIEFYECISTGITIGVINYDTRCRNIQLETDKNYCLSKLHQLASLIRLIESDKAVSLHMRFSSGEEPVCMESSLTRELVFAMEHSVHHMAIIKMALTSINSSVKLPQNFGVAFSTVCHQASSHRSN